MNFAPMMRLAATLSRDNARLRRLLKTEREHNAALIIERRRLQDEGRTLRARLNRGKE